MNDEERGLIARIAVLDQEVAAATAQLKGEKRKHWSAYYEAQLFDSLRKRDVLTERLQTITKKVK